MSKTKNITAGLVTVFMLFFATPALAEDAPASDPETPVEESTPTETGGELPQGAPVDDEKPATPCQSSCLEHAKLCNDSCKSLSDDDVEQNDCNKACLAVFTGDKGFCYSHCEASEKFLTPCKPEIEDAPARTSDECLDGCEDHYGTCVMTCRDNIKDKVKMKECYNGCTQIFAEETGFCKSQCDVEAGFMQVCE